MPKQRHDEKHVTEPVIEDGPDQQIRAQRQGEAGQEQNEAASRFRMVGPEGTERLQRPPAPADGGNDKR